ncbi:MAG: Integral membrane protein [Parcubacteria group bacterium GW2011_GWF2_38_76]|nr:MAG: Integral membrane protein [Parcubacteria group bacterium GW2011_GWF2_38_76]
MYFLLRWLLSIVTLVLITKLVPGIEFTSTFLNALIRPLLILLTLPINILTLGLFTLIINAFVFWLAGTIVKGFEISDFNAAFFGALIYWLIATILGYLEKKKK